jgi:hypothetical protein
VVTFTVGHFNPGERAPGTHCVEDWAGLRDSLNAVAKRKISTLPGIESRSFNLQPSQYNDWKMAVLWVVAPCSLVLAAFIIRAMSHRPDDGGSKDL